MNMEGRFTTASSLNAVSSPPAPLPASSELVGLLSCPCKLLGSLPTTILSSLVAKFEFPSIVHLTSTDLSIYPSTPLIHPGCDLPLTVHSVLNMGYILDLCLRCLCTDETDAFGFTTRTSLALCEHHKGYHPLGTTSVGSHVLIDPESFAHFSVVHDALGRLAIRYPDCVATRSACWNRSVSISYLPSMEVVRLVPGEPSSAGARPLTIPVPTRSPNFQHEPVEKYLDRFPATLSAAGIPYPRRNSRLSSNAAPFSPRKKIDDFLDFLIDSELFCLDLVPKLAVSDPDDEFYQEPLDPEDADVPAQSYSPLLPPGVELPKEAPVSLMKKWLDLKVSAQVEASTEFSYVRKVTTPTGRRKPPNSRGAAIYVLPQGAPAPTFRNKKVQLVTVPLESLSEMRRLAKSCKKPSGDTAKKVLTRALDKSVYLQKKLDRELKHLRTYDQMRRVRLPEPIYEEDPTSSESEPEEEEYIDAPSGVPPSSPGVFSSILNFFSSVSRAPATLNDLPTFLNAFTIEQRTALFEELDSFRQSVKGDVDETLVKTQTAAKETVSHAEKTGTSLLQQLGSMSTSLLDKGQNVLLTMGCAAAALYCFVSCSREWNTGLAIIGSVAVVGFCWFSGVFSHVSHWVSKALDWFSSEKEVDQSGSFEHVARIIVAGMSYISIKSVPSGRQMHEALSCLGGWDRASKGSIELVTWLKQVFLDITNCIRSWLKLPELEKARSGIKELDDWVGRVSARLKKAKEHTAIEFEDTRVLTSLIEEGRRLQMSFMHHPEKMLIFNIVQQYLRALDPLVSLCESFSGAAMRIMPVGMWITGESGVGKSSLTDDLSKRACLHVFRESVSMVESLKKAPLAYVYSRNAADPYMSGLRNDHVVITWNDWAQSKVPGATDALEVLYMIDTAPYHANMAHLEEKKGIFPSPRLCLVTTNQPTVPDDLMRHRVALDRRFSIRVKVSVQRKYATEDSILKSNGDPFKWKINLAAIPTVNRGLAWCEDVYWFWDIDFDGVPIAGIKPYNYQTLVSKMCAQLDQNELNSRAFASENERHHRERCDAVLTQLRDTNQSGPITPAAVEEKLKAHSVEQLIEPISQEDKVDPESEDADFKAAVLESLAQAEAELTHCSPVAPTRTPEEIAHSTALKAQVERISKATESWPLSVYQKLPNFVRGRTSAGHIKGLEGIFSDIEQLTIAMASVAPSDRPNFGRRIVAAPLADMIQVAHPLWKADVVNEVAYRLVLCSMLPTREDPTPSGRSSPQSLVLNSVWPCWLSKSPSLTTYTLCSRTGRLLPSQPLMTFGIVLLLLKHVSTFANSQWLLLLTLPLSPSLSLLSKPLLGRLVWVSRPRLRTTLTLRNPRSPLATYRISPRPPTSPILRSPRSPSNMSLFVLRIKAGPLSTRPLATSV